jgi:hypothetical protein
MHMLVLARRLNYTDRLAGLVKRGDRRARHAYGIGLLTLEPDNELQNLTAYAERDDQVVSLGWAARQLNFAIASPLEPAMAKLRAYSWACKNYAVELSRSAIYREGPQVDRNGLDRLEQDLAQYRMPDEALRRARTQIRMR